MTVGIIITLCLLVLLAYSFDFTSARTRIPSVILLMALGFAVRKLCQVFDINLINLQTVLPVIGSIGLVLIVLEGALELELNRTKLPLVRRSFVVAVLPILLLSFLLALAIHYLTGYPFKSCLANTIPLSIISSAIAIPSTRSFTAENREFVIYESSISDIIGVILFNFVVLHSVYGVGTFLMFFTQMLVIIVVSFIATGGLSFLLSRIDHEVKFVPIIFLVILVYETSKIIELPSLLFILVFGLFLNNLDKLRGFHWIDVLQPRLLRKEVHKFKEITIEGTFLVRALFFIIFGYSIRTEELVDVRALGWSVGITLGIFIIRAATLWMARAPLRSLLFVAPRGLITILLFLSIAPELRIPVIDRAVVTQVILMTALLLMAGSLLQNRRDATLYEAND